MAIQMVNYDRMAPGKDYEPLYEAIRKASGGDWCHVLKSQWLVSTNLNSQQVYAQLAPYIDRNDRLLITALTGEMYWSQLPADVVTWIRRKIG